MKPQYDIKTLKGNERAADGWTGITLANTDGLCGAAQGGESSNPSRTSPTTAAQQIADCRCPLGADHGIEMVLRPRVALARAALEPGAVGHPHIAAPRRDQSLGRQLPGSTALTVVR